MRVRPAQRRVWWKRSRKSGLRRDRMLTFRELHAILNGTSICGGVCHRAIVSVALFMPVDRAGPPVWSVDCNSSVLFEAEPCDGSRFFVMAGMLFPARRGEMSALLLTDAARCLRSSGDHAERRFLQTTRLWRRKAVSVEYAVIEGAKLLPDSSARRLTETENPL